MLKVEKTKLDGVLLVKPDCFEDFRGVYVETYNEKAYNEAGIDVKFVQDDYSWSTKHVLRGLHGDATTWKLVSCPIGKLMLAVVNYDKESPQYRQWETFILSERNCQQVLVPPKFANGHLVLSDRAVFSYKQSTYYSGGTQFTVKWNDPEVGIWWPVKEPILSKRDELSGH
jgi:dTDP-4-dehydrorhamnose 3,5-epimerase